MPNEACSNQSVTQQWAGTVPQRTRIASHSGMVAHQGVGAEVRPADSTAAQPSTSRPTNSAMCRT